MLEGFAWHRAEAKDVTLIPDPDNQMKKIRDFDCPRKTSAPSSLISRLCGKIKEHDRKERPVGLAYDRALVKIKG